VLGLGFDPAVGLEIVEPAERVQPRATASAIATATAIAGVIATAGVGAIATATAGVGATATAMVVATATASASASATDIGKRVFFAGRNSALFYTHLVYFIGFYSGFHG
jgi:hypothetical protein